MAKEEKKKKKKLRWQVKLFLIIFILILYIFLIGPKGMFIREFKIFSNKISDKMNGLKILQISDIHYGSTVNEKTIKTLVEKANETKPDIVIFTGDLINKKYKITDEEKESLKKNLRKIKSELGKYYVTGEEDFEDANLILNSAMFINLDNNPQLIYNMDNNPILLIDENGCADFFKNNTNISYFKMLILHDPDKIDNVKENNFDVAIAGHTHNGTINIPKLRDLFIKSKYKNSYQKVGNTSLYINPGIGTGSLKVRLFNHPTMYLYRLSKTST